MKILFITYYFAPYNTIGAVRTTRTAEKLIEMGHDVKVISANEQYLPKNLSTSFPKENVFYTKWFNPKKYIPYKSLPANDFSLPNKNTLGKVKDLIIRSLKIFYSNILAKPDSFVGWFSPAKAQAVNLIDNGWEPDLIYASASPYTSLLIAQSISKRYSIPWVGELRDLWSDNHYFKSNWIDRFLERKTLSTASHLVTVSEPLAQVLKRKYKCPVSVIYNAYDESDFINLSTDVSSEKIKIIYTGTIYENRRDPTPLFLAIVSNGSLRSKVKVDFYGPDLSYISYLIDKYKLEDCVFTHNPVARDMAIKLQQESDVLLLLTWDDPREKGILTGKLFEYIGSGNAILSIGAIEDDASKIIVDNNFGIATNTPEKIEEFILNFVKDKYINQELRGNYERTTQIENLVNIFESVACN